MQFLSRNKINLNAWDTFVDQSKDGWLWQRSEYIDAYALWPGVTDVSFAAVDEQHNIQAIFPAHIRQARGDPTSFFRELSSRGGPCLKQNLSLQEEHTVRIALYAHLQKIALHHKAFHVEVSLPSLSPVALPPQLSISNPLACYQFKNMAEHTWLIDLTSGFNPNTFSRSTRALINKATNSGLTLSEASPADVSQYYTLHQTTYARTKKQTHPLAYFRHIFDCCIPKELCRVLFAKAGDVVVAANVTALYKNAAYYWMGSSLRIPESHGANHLLMSEQIKNASVAGKSFFETGDAYFRCDNIKKEGISDFKKRFGAHLCPSHKGYWELNASRKVLRQVIRAFIKN